MGMDVYGRKPSSKVGEYFRASVWSWRPLHRLCEAVLKRELRSWGFNDGDGLHTQKECDDLAGKLERYLSLFPNERITMESDLRVDSRGVFIGKMSEGVKGGETPYEIDRDHIGEFISFLRACGGFRIK